MRCKNVYSDPDIDFTGYGPGDPITLISTTGTGTWTSDSTTGDICYTEADPCVESTATFSIVNSDGCCEMQFTVTAECCAPCSNCIQDPDDCNVSLQFNDMQFGPGFDHTGFSPTPSVVDDGGWDVVIDYVDATNNLTSGFDDIIPVDAADAEAKLKQLLEENLGGIWTVTAVDTGSGIQIVDVTSVNATFQIAELHFTQLAGAGDFSDHTFNVSAYEDPFVAEAIALGVAGNPLPTDFGGECRYAGSIPLPVSGGEFKYEFNILPASIDALIELCDDVGTPIADATFRYDATAGPYQCHRRYDLSVTGTPFAIDGPSNGLGPAPGPIVDWDGLNNLSMNITELPGA